MAIPATSITVSKKRDFADLPISFLLHPNKKDVTALKGADAIKQAVKNLILTNFGDRPFHPEIGGNVVKYLFENVNAYTGREVADTCRDVINKYEPRVRINDVNVVFAPDNNAMEVSINFNIVGLNEAQDVSISLNRTR